MRTVKNILQALKHKFRLRNRIREYFLLHTFKRQNAFSKASLVDSNKVVSNGELIISLTTYSSRIEYVYLTIESIARQTCKPNRIILWLDESEFNTRSLPKSLVNLQHRGLEIRYCPNYRSYKKMFPTWQCYPDATVITIDDDILYPANMIQILVNESVTHPKMILGHRAHRITYQNGKVNPYQEWELESRIHESLPDVFITTGGGTLFPPNWLKEEQLNNTDYLDLAPTADDLWIKFMSLKNNVECKKVSSSKHFRDEFIFISKLQAQGLYHENMHRGNNDKTIEILSNYFEISL